MHQPAVSHDFDSVRRQILEHIDDCGDAALQTRNELIDSLANYTDHQDAVVELLSRCAQSACPDTRLAGVQTLGKIPSINRPETVRILTDALNDPLIEIRCAACEALGQAKFESIAPVFTQLLKKQDPDLLWPVSLTLARHQDTDGLESLLSLMLHHHAWADNTDGLQVLLNTPDLDIVADLFRKVLASDDFEARIRATRLLCEKPVPAVLDALKPNLEETWSTELHELTIQAIEALNSFSSKRVLQDHKNIRHWFMHKDLSPYYNRLGNIEYLNALINGESDFDDEISDAAERCFDRLRGTPAVSSILGLLADSRNYNYDNFETALNVLGMIKDPAAVEGIIKLLRQPPAANDQDDPDIRIDAVEALGEIGDSRAIPAILELVNDKNDALRYKVMQTLGLFADPAIIKPAESGLDDKDEDTAQYAAMALAKYRHAEARERLLKYLRDPAGIWRDDITRALGYYDDDQVIKTLTAALRDEEPDVREQAAHALARIGNPVCLHSIQQQLQNEEDEDVLDALEEAAEKLQSGNRNIHFLLPQGQEQDSGDEPGSDIRHTSTEVSAENLFDPALVDTWNRQGRDFARLFREYTEQSFAESPTDSAEYPDDQREAIAVAVLERLELANRMGIVEQFRDQYPPSSYPFEDLFDNIEEFLPPMEITIIDDTRVALTPTGNTELDEFDRQFLRGEFDAELSADDPEHCESCGIPEDGLSVADESWFLENDRLTTAHHLQLCGRSMNGRYFAKLVNNRIVVTDGWDGPETLVVEHSVPENIFRLVPTNNGQRVCVVARDNVYVMHRFGFRLLLPDFNGRHHLALAPDNRYLVAGHPDSEHCVFDEQLDRINSIPPMVDSGDFALFSSDSKQLLLGSSSFDANVTISVQTDALQKGPFRNPETDSRINIVSKNWCFSAGVALDDGYILGDTTGCLTGFDSSGQQRWYHCLGGRIVDIALSGNRKTLWVSTSYGTVHKFTIGKGLRDEHTVASSDLYEEYRILFLPETPPLIW